MAPAAASPTPTPTPTVDPRNQTFYLEGPHNVSIPVRVSVVDKMLHVALGTAINYGSQIGACFIMLLVTLTMTSRSRFSRASTLINVAALVVGAIRSVLLALYFTSSYMEFYTFFSGDYSQINRNDTRISIVATLSALPLQILIEAALFLQAYSMIQLWPSLWKNLILVLSSAIVVLSIAFKTAAIAFRIRATVDLVSTNLFQWVYRADLTFTATIIFWFCFIFIIRLVIHMIEYRSILPPMGGLTAVEVLVMTNGMLMLIPALFAAMELGGFTGFEAGSLSYTSVVVLLPLGTLLAQNMTRRNVHVSGSSRESGGRSRRTGHSGRSGQSGRSALSALSARLGRPGVRVNSTSSASSGNAHDRACSRATTDTANSKTQFLSSWPHASDTTVPYTGGIVTTQVKIQAGKGVVSSPAAPSAELAASAVHDSGFAKSKTADAASGNELVPIGPVMSTAGHGDANSNVWVGHEVQVHRDMV